MEYDALYKLTHGLYVLGAFDEEKQRYAGSVVDAVMQVANKPWVIAVSCMNTSYTKKCIEETKEFSLSVLGKNVSPQIFIDFAFQSSKDADKWKDTSMFIKDGLPYLNGSLANFRAKVLQKHVFESNTLFIAEVVDCACGVDEDPLTYNDYRSYFKDIVLDIFKKNKEVKMTEKTEEKKQWVCTVCGYVYDGETPFEDLPEDWLCPLCGVGKEFFELR